MDEYVNKPCERCGSKKRVSKRWTGTIATLSGTTKVAYSQIICTNAICQQAFDENLKKEVKARETLRLQKEERDKIRKANSLLLANKSHKKKLKN